MVVRYAATGTSDELSCRALLDSAAAAMNPVVVGAWMTRLWILGAGAGQLPRLTNDVDIAALPEIGSPGFGGALAAVGYERDTLGYPFRYAKQTPNGVRIIDFLTDAAREPVEPAFPVYGLDVAARQLVDLTVEIQSIGTASVRIPSLDGAFLLRALALADGAAGLKFADYARDASSLGELLLADESALTAWRGRDGDVVARAREIALPLFSTSTGPGPLAVAQRALGDPDLAARRASATVNDLFGSALRGIATG